MELSREQNRIRFSDTNGIVWEQWNLIHKKLNHLGYAFEEPDDVKAYFNRGVLLREDQSFVVLEVLGLHKKQELYPKEQVEGDIARAKELFGTTEIMSHAGYLLPDGEMLNFSEDGYTRTMDHRQVMEALSPSDKDRIVPGSNTHALIRFLNYGCVRLMGNNFECSRPLTREQERTLAQEIPYMEDFFYVDISNELGHVVWSKNYAPGTNSQVVFCDIRNYFKSLEIETEKAEIPKYPFSAYADMDIDLEQEL